LLPSRELFVRPGEKHRFFMLKVVAVKGDERAARLDEGTDGTPIFPQDAQKRTDHLGVGFLAGVLVRDRPKLRVASVRLPGQRGEKDLPLLPLVARQKNLQAPAHMAYLRKIQGSQRPFQAVQKRTNLFVLPSQVFGGRRSHSRREASGLPTPSDLRPRLPAGENPAPVRPFTRLKDHGIPLEAGTILALLLLKPASGGTL
jgi:hypothetical protein